MKKHWMPRVVGISELYVAIFLAGIMTYDFISFYARRNNTSDVDLTPIIELFAIPLLLIIISGGINAVRQRSWRWTLAASITMFIISIFLAITFIEDYFHFGLELTVQSPREILWLIMIVVSISTLIFTVISKKYFVKSDIKKPKL